MITVLRTNFKLQAVKNCERPYRRYGSLLRTVPQVPLVSRATGNQHHAVDWPLFPGSSEANHQPKLPKMLPSKVAEELFSLLGGPRGISTVLNPDTSMSKGFIERWELDVDPRWIDVKNQPPDTDGNKDPTSWVPLLHCTPSDVDGVTPSSDGDSSIHPSLLKKPPSVSQLGGIQQGGAHPGLLPSSLGDCKEGESPLAKDGNGSDHATSSHLKNGKEISRSQEGMRGEGDEESEKTLGQLQSTTGGECVSESHEARSHPLDEAHQNAVGSEEDSRGNIEKEKIFLKDENVLESQERMTAASNHQEAATGEESVVEEEEEEPVSEQTPFLGLDVQDIPDCPDVETPLSLEQDFQEMVGEAVSGQSTSDQGAKQLHTEQEYQETSHRTTSLLSEEDDSYEVACACCSSVSKPDGAWREELVEPKDTEYPELQELLRSCSTEQEEMCKENYEAPIRQHRVDRAAGPSAELEQAVGQTEASPGPLEPRTDELEASLGSLEPRTDELEASLGPLEPRTDELEASLGPLEPRTDELEASPGPLEPRTDELEASPGPLEPRTDELEASLGPLEPRTDELEASPGPLEPRTDEQEASPGPLEPRTDELENSESSEVEQNTFQDVMGRVQAMRENTSELNGDSEQQWMQALGLAQGAAGQSQAPPSPRQPINVPKRKRAPLNDEEVFYKKPKRPSPACSPPGQGPSPRPPPSIPIPAECAFIPILLESDLERVETARGKPIILGSGAYGDVHLMRRKSDGLLVALKRLKEVKNQMKAYQGMLSEIRPIVAMQNHDQFPKFIGIVDQTAFATEFIGDPATKTSINLVAAVTGPFNLTKLDWIRISLQISRGLQALHAAGWIHCDLHGGNIMVLHHPNSNRWSAKIIDLGSAVRIDTPPPLVHYNDQEKWFCRRLCPQIAPEIIDGLPMSIETDIYSMGALLVSSKAAAQKDELAEIYEIGMRCAVDDPNARPSLPEIINELEALYQNVVESESLKHSRSSSDSRSPKLA